MSYEEQIMSKDKYPSMFSPQMEAIVFIIFQIFFARRAVLKIGEYYRIFSYGLVHFCWSLQNLLVVIYSKLHSKSCDYLYLAVSINYSGLS